MMKSYEVEVNEEFTEIWRVNGKFHCEHGPAVRNLRDDRLEDVYYLQGKRFCSRKTWMDALLYNAVLLDLQNAYEDSETAAMRCDMQLAEVEQEHSDAVMAQTSADTKMVEAYAALIAHKTKSGV